MKLARLSPGGAVSDGVTRPGLVPARNLPGVPVNEWLNRRSFNPLTAVSWAAVYFAEDANWAHPANGASVPQWDDASGNSRHMSQATVAKQPTYVASESTLNNRPALNLARSSAQTLNTATFTGLAPPFSWVVIARLTNVTGEHWLLSSGTADAVFYETNSPQLWSLYNGTNRATTTSDTSPHLHVAVFNGASSLHDKDGTVTAVASPGTPSVVNVRLGDYAFNNTAWDGPVAFVGLYAGDFTAHARYGEFKQWAAAHYGLTVA